MFLSKEFRNFEIIFNKISPFILRDFGEIINMQNVHENIYNKFVNNCLLKIENNCHNTLSKIYPEVDILFLGKQQNSINYDKDTYIIIPLDGILNFSRGINYFGTLIAFFSSKEKKITSVAINDYSNDNSFFYKTNSIPLLNRKKIHTSSKQKIENAICIVENYELIDLHNLNNKNLSFRISNCFILDLAYFSSGRSDIIIHTKKGKLYNSIINLIVKEAKGMNFEKESYCVITNNIINI